MKNNPGRVASPAGIALRPVGSVSARLVIRATSATTTTVITGGIVGTATAADMARSIIGTAPLSHVTGFIIAATALAHVSCGIVVTPARHGGYGGG